MRWRGLDGQGSYTGWPAEEGLPLPLNLLPDLEELDLVGSSGSSQPATSETLAWFLGVLGVGDQ
jgi:hypothetical protein